MLGEVRWMWASASFLVCLNHHKNTPERTRPSARHPQGTQTAHQAITSHSLLLSLTHSPSILQSCSRSHPRLATIKRRSQFFTSLFLRLSSSSSSSSTIPTSPRSNHLRPRFSALDVAVASRVCVIRASCSHSNNSIPLHQSINPLNN